MISKISAIKLIIIGVLLQISVSTKATTYYFSSSTGSDNNTSGQANNQATPWQSISKLNAIMSSLNPGDIVLFKRGDTFPGTITIGASGSSGNPITFGVYGTGTAKAILDNRLTLTGWSNLGGNIWEASNSALQNQPTAFFIDNILEPLARYPNIDAPNGGYLSISSHPSGSQTEFTDNNLSTATNWTGAEIVLRADHYVLSRRNVAAQSGQTITLSSNTMLNDKFGYFFQNHPAALDKDGEWCYIAATKKIRIYSNTDPNSRVIKAANTDNYITIDSKSYITIDGFGMYGAKKCAITLLGVSYCTIKNCEFIGSGINALNIGTFGSTVDDSITISNNIFKETQSNCINAYGKRLTFKGNTLTNTGMVPGMAESGQHAFGIYTLTDGLDIVRNVFDHTGYIAIGFLWSSNVLVKENNVNTFCSVIDDGGGIYCWKGDEGSEPVNRKIINNVVINGVGAKNGTDGSDAPAEGIYIDDRSPNVEITGNTVAFCANSGILIHNSANCSVKNNTVFACKRDLWISHDNNAPTFPVVNSDIQNNIFASKEQDGANSQLMKFETNDQSSLANLGILDNNTYCQPFLQEGYIYYSDNNTSNRSMNVDKWNAFSGFDQHSAISPVSFPANSIPDDNLRFEYNATSVSRSITADKNYISPKGISYTKGNTITLQPFSSVILLKADISTDVKTAMPAKKKAFMLYPNPAEDKVFIQTQDSNHPIEATLFDVSGRQIKREILSTGSYINLTSLPPGVYVVRILDNNITEALKLIKR